MASAMRARTGMSPEAQMLFCGGLCPEDERRLTEYKIHGSPMLRLSLDSVCEHSHEVTKQVCSKQESVRYILLKVA